MGRLTIAMSLAAVLAVGCRPKFPLCRNDSDCTDEEGNKTAVHCFDGQCQECRADTDCAGGKSCQSMRCLSAPTSAAPAASGSSPLPPPGPAAAAAATDCHLDKVLFEFDRADLGPAAEAELGKVAQCLQQKGIARVRVEGFCDERGTEEYNLQLGQRRAAAVEKYLEALGVQRVSTISFGKEDPVCTDNTEACWKRNRRAEFDVGKK